MVKLEKIKSHIRDRNEVMITRNKSIKKGMG